MTLRRLPASGLAQEAGRTYTVPYQGKHTGLLVTKERSPLKPQTERKYYQP